MEGSEKESPCEGSSTSRGPNTAGEASTASLGLSGIGESKEEPETEEEEELGGLAAGTAGAAAEEEEGGEISLREWLDKPERAVDHLECLHIFRQVVEAVSFAHSHGVVVTNVRPSCFVMSAMNLISFIESDSCSLSGSDHFEDGCGSDGKDGGSRHSSPSGIASQRIDDESATAMCLLPVEKKEEIGFGELGKNGDENMSFPLKKVLDLECHWYTSPEECAGDQGIFPSDVYRLGVLLFELFCTFDSLDEKLGDMANLRHRVLPPKLLLKWPQQASFCLWLLHPQPNSRPKMSEMLQSELLNEPRDSLEERKAAIRLREEIEDQELLLEFVLLLQKRKQEAVDKLQDKISFLSADIDEVLNRTDGVKKEGESSSELNKDGQSVVEVLDQTSSGSPKRFRPGFPNYNVEDQKKNLFECHITEAQANSKQNDPSRMSRFMKNFEKLEADYFSTRHKMAKQPGKPTNRELPVPSCGRWSVARNGGSSICGLASNENHSEGRSEWIDTFFDSLSKYLSFSKLKVQADLKQGDLLNSSSLICSLGFDRDKELFATAGVNKKIKIFEYNMILNEDSDIHYPVAEVAGRSQFSSICWNSYIKSQIASSDFDGVVQVWDATRGEVLAEMREHERRAWSVDFSHADPTKLASGSDDGAVKLWNINQAGSIGTIRTKTNVCSVQFPPDSSLFLAIGSADHNVYYFDIRNFRVPYQTLIGHAKTVSYVKFLDSKTIVSASTDNSLKLWDLSLSTSRVLHEALQTFTGHTNIKNFVGLSLSDGYIATGSETNEVFVYHKAFPMPVLSYKFACTDTISGCEVDDTGQFISCVCWRGQSSTLLAANSSGNIKLLEMC